MAVSRSALKEVIDTWAGWLQACREKGIPREGAIAIPDKLALALIGVRRSGKSFTAASLIRNLADVFYMNFEDPLFIEHRTPAVLDDLISVFTEYHKTSPALLLFDEIHNIDGWERWVRKVVDLQQYRVIVTGSSAKMLSSELATALTGRCLSRTVWPLSFREFLKFHKRQCRNDNEYLGALRDYMMWGGFPEVALTHSEDQKKALLQQYLTDILYKDIIRRNEIRTTSGLETLTHYYLTNISNLHSYNSVHKAFGINVETAKDYTKFLQEAFLVFELNRYHPNFKVQSRDPKKIYSIDTGLRNANASTQSEDLGRLAENLVYLELRRRGAEISYFKESQEVDFVVTHFGKPKEAIQVCYADLAHHPAREREIGALLECLEATKLSQGWLLTQKGEERLRKGKKEIALVPLHKWFLEGPAAPLSRPVEFFF